MTATAPMPGLHGREAETGVLGRALDRAASGHLAVVLAEGEAGIGKTRLLAETLTQARGRGMSVAAGHAGELESARPFGVIAEALECARPSADPRRSAIAALLSTRGGGSSPITVSSDQGLRFRAVDAITDLAEELAVDRPLVIGLDDLQWADQSSLLTLAALSRRLADHPAALIACFRPSPRDPALQRLLDSLAEAGAQHLAVRRLDDRAVSALAAELLAAEPGPHLLAEVAGAAGNPLFVTMSAAMTNLALVAEHRGHLPDALRIIDDAVRLADQSPGRQGHRYPVHMHRGHILIGLDRLADAGISLITGRKMSEELGIRWPPLTYQVLLALNHFLAGEWDDAVAELEAGIGMADEAGETYLLPLGYDIMALIRLHRNNMAGARQAAAAAEAQLAGTGAGGRRPDGRA